MSVGLIDTEVNFFRNPQGALYRALQAFKEEGVNLTNIESRPSGSKAWDYNFFVRMDGHEQDKGNK